MLAIALGGVLVGMRLAGSDTYDTALGQVRLEVEPHLTGQVDAYIPIADWGLRAAAFHAPVRLRAEVRSLNRKTVLRAAGGDAAILTRTERQLGDAANAAVLREALFALGGGLLAALLAITVLRATGKRRRRLLATTGGAIALTAIAIVGISILVLRSTFDAGAFQRPRFYAKGAELLQLLDVATKADQRAQRYRSKVQATLLRLSSLLAETDLQSGGFAEVDGGRRALLASDLHANGLVIDSLEQLTRGEAPIFFVGDFGHTGSAGEIKLVVRQLKALAPRVTAVSGNHDSRALMERLAEEGVTVLESNGKLTAGGAIVGSPVIDVGGMRVAGWADPLEWVGDDPDDPERIFSFEELDDGDEQRRAAEEDLVGWFDRLPERPDVVLVHQNGLAQRLATTLAARPDHAPLVILTGHDHKQHVDRHGDIVVVDAGSVGAGGVLGIGDERVGVGDLHFSNSSAALAAVDLIEAEPFTGGASAQRVIVEDHPCPDEETSCQLSP